MDGYKLKFKEVLEGCQISDSFSTGGNEWKNAAGRGID